MALVAAASAAPLKPEIRLSRALFNYETVLTESQKQDYHQAGAPSHNAVITLTCEVSGFGAYFLCRSLVSFYKTLFHG